MPSSKRDKLKRRLGSAVNNMDKSLAELKVVHETFIDVHPELAEGLEVAIRLLIHSQEIIGTFSEKCWKTSMDTLRKYA